MQERANRILPTTLDPKMNVNSRGRVKSDHRLMPETQADYIFSLSRFCDSGIPRPFSDIRIDWLGQNEIE